MDGSAKDVAVVGVPGMPESALHRSAMDSVDILYGHTTQKRKTKQKQKQKTEKRKTIEFVVFEEGEGGGRGIRLGGKMKLNIGRILLYFHLLQLGTKWLKNTRHIHHYRVAFGISRRRITATTNC